MSAGRKDGWNNDCRVIIILVLFFVLFFPSSMNITNPLVLR